MSDDVPVTATWADIGGEYVGVWIEDGKDYLFRFRLGKPTQALEPASDDRRHLAKRPGTKRFA